MTQAENQPDDSSRRGKKTKYIIAIALFIAGSGAGYAGNSIGLFDAIPGLKTRESHEESGEVASHSSPFPSPSEAHFIDIPTVVATLPRGYAHSHVRFTMKLDVPAQYVDEVVALEPRIVDVLNTYLRAVRPEDFEKPQALMMIRTHILARMQVVAGSGRVNDVLIQEFVLN